MFESHFIKENIQKTNKHKQVLKAMSYQGNRN